MSTTQESAGLLLSNKASTAAAHRTRGGTSHEWAGQTHLSGIQHTQCCPVKALMRHWVLLAAVHWWIPPRGNFPAVCPHGLQPLLSLRLHYWGRTR